MEFVRQQVLLNSRFFIQNDAIVSTPKVGYLKQHERDLYGKIILHKRKRKNSNFRDIVDDNHKDGDIVENQKCSLDNINYVIGTNNDDNSWLPKEYKGFILTQKIIKPYTFEKKIDQRAVVSLAFYNYNFDYLQAYLPKLPLMCINVNRLVYTVNAFALFNPLDERLVEKALKFLIITDIETLPTIRTIPILNYTQFNVYTKDIEQIESNELFSLLLHRLQNPGYELYIFTLAHHLGMNVDLVKKNETLLQYSISSKSSVGVLTAINDDSEWYVKSTRDHILL